MERGEERTGKRGRKKSKFSSFFSLLFFLPTPGLTHNDSTFLFLYRMLQRNNRMEEMPLQLRKERFSWYMSREWQKSSAIQMLLFFFFLFIKEQKTCLLQNVSSTVFVSEIFLLLQRERFLCSSYLSVCLCLYRVSVCVQVCVCMCVFVGIHKLSRDRTTHHSFLWSTCLLLLSA